MVVSGPRVNVSFNHRNPQGKTIEAVDDGYGHFVSLANQASTLMRQVVPVVGCSASKQSEPFYERRTKRSPRVPALDRNERPLWVGRRPLAHAVDGWLV